MPSLAKSTRSPSRRVVLLSRGGSCASGRLGVPLNSPIIGARGEGQAVGIIEKCAWEPVVIRGLKVLHSADAVAGGSEHSLALAARVAYTAGALVDMVSLVSCPIKTLPKQRGEVIQSSRGVINGLREQIVLACACGEEHSVAICVEEGAATWDEEAIKTKQQQPAV